MQDLSFHCSICFQNCTKPVSCPRCGLYYCNTCIITFWAPNPIQCIQCECQQIEVVGAPGQKPITITTAQGPSSPDLLIAQQQSNDPCGNFPICKQNKTKLLESLNVCSTECYMFLILMPLRAENNFQKMREEIIRIQQEIKIKLSTQAYVSIISYQPSVTGTINLSLGVSQFNFALKSPQIQVVDNLVSLVEELYVFRTVLADVDFYDGVHYWEIYPETSTENELKVGVTKKKDIDLNTGFCDTKNGFAYYTVGQLRNGSNSNGDAYGVRFKNRGCLGVMLDMERGTLSFAYDGVFLGVAYQNPELKVGPITPATALLHKAAFKLKTGIPVPKYIQTAYFR